MHMALDEVLLEGVISGDRRPTLRLWEWIEPALVIGSHQSVINEVDSAAARELGFTVTRRMSGGGTMLCEPGRTITYSLYLPDSVVAGVSFRKSYALLDGWAVRAFVELGVPAGYREINDIISPRGKIAGAAQARRRGFVLHHTTIAHSMDVDLLPESVRLKELVGGVRLQLSEFLPPLPGEPGARTGADNSNPSLFQIMDEIERRIICDMLERTNWNQTEAAEQFQVPLSTLNQKIKRLGIDARRRNPGRTGGDEPVVSVAGK